MNIDPNRLTVRRLTDFAAVETLYRERMKKDFARNELRPLANLRRSWERDAYDCYGLFRGEEILGYAFFVRLGGNYLFDYLAIAGEHRDEGLGSAFLRLLAGCFADADCTTRWPARSGMRIPQSICAPATGRPGCDPSCSARTIGSWRCPRQRRTRRTNCGRSIPRCAGAFCLPPSFAHSFTCSKETEQHG